VDEFKLYRKKKLNEQEKRDKAYLDKVAGIIAASGKPAVVALATYGVGPERASRILSRNHQSDDEFYVALLEAQKTFIKTRRYWAAH
jgi:ATP-dependent Lhr-like helicase